MDNEKKDHGRNIVVIALLLAAMGAMFFLSRGFGAEPSAEAERIALLPASGNADEAGAAAYVLCRLPASGQYGLLPLPAEGEVSYPVSQTFADGAHSQNVLHLTAEGFYMESSTCRNQNCVQQGMVTLENRHKRVLQNCVICLPNQLIAELYTAKELAEMELPGFERAMGQEE